MNTTVAHSTQNREILDIHTKKIKIIISYALN